MTDHVLWLSLRPADQSAILREELWGQLVTWCHARSLFIGGLLEGVVVYAPVAPITHLQYRQLRAWLQGRAEIYDFQMELKEVSTLHGLGAKAACIEAVSQAQEFLAERMTGCAMSLAGITAALGQRWQASVIAGGTSLELRMPHVQLQLSVSRMDRAPPPEFERFANKRLRLSDIEGLIPALMTLHWHQLEGVSDLSVGEWVAENRGWRINLCADPGSSLDHREVMRRWMEWLCAGG
ncbi:MAG: hypothetical protein ACREBY_01925 [Polaromonas sp.]